MEVFKSTKYQGVKVCPELEQLLQALFHKNPQLEFHATNSRPVGLTSDAMICNVDVFDGDQKLGAVGWIRKYSPSGYDNVYRIYSRRIQKYRGDKHAKHTKELKSALKTCMDVFVRDSDAVVLAKLSKEFKSVYLSIVWEAHRQYERVRDPLLKPAFGYLLSVIDGSPNPIDPKVLQAVKSDEFKQGRDTCRIAESVKKVLETDTGALVYVDRENRLTLLDLSTATATKLASTYDLPKNYQEKYTILKVMEFKQPIENIGVKLNVTIEDVKYEMFYLAPGDTVVTH